MPEKRNVQKLVVFIEIQKRICYTSQQVIIQHMMIAFYAV